MKKGDRIGIWSPNSYEWVITQFAAAKIGAILVNVNPGYREKELEYCLNLAKCHTIITCQSFKSSNYFKILENVAPGITGMKDGIGIHHDKFSFLKNLIFIDQKEETAPSNVTRFSQLLSSGSTDEFRVSDDITFDDAINIQFTSGTTGNPKGATLTHHNIINNSYFTGKRLLGGLQKKIICVPNPLYHCFGSINGVITGIMFNGTAVLPAPVASPKPTLIAIDKYACDIVYGTPTMFVDILNESTLMNFKRTSIKRMVMSGAPCPVEAIKKLHSTFPNLKLVSLPYGSTETSPVMTIPEPDIPEKYAYDTVGRVIEHVELKIADPETGKVLKRGEAGEVRSRGFSTFLGYWNEPEKTAEAVDSNRWYKTGDIGIMNDEGYVLIVGRIKDMIIRGGENIYPREIEDFILSHPSVADINVVGIPDERMGEEVCACIILKNGLKGSDEMSQDIRNFCRDKISHFKIPRYVLFVADFPRTITMKIQKHRLKDVAKEMLGIQ